MFVVDATVGATDADEAVVRMLRRSGKPVILAANKVDDQPGSRPTPRAVVARPRRAVPGLGAARPGQRRPARRRPRRAARPHRRIARPRRRVRAGSRCRQAERRQVQPAQPARRRGAGGRRPGRRHHRDPVDELVELGGETWRFVDTAGIRRRVHEASGTEYYASLRTARRDRGGRGRRRARRRERADQRAGPADHLHGHRGRPRARPRLQQVGPRRRGAPALPRAGDRAGPAPRPVGAPGQHLRADRPARRPARAGAAMRARGLGHPGADRPAQRSSWASSSPPPRTRCAAASSRASCSPPRPRPGRPRFVLFTTGFLEAGYRRFVERRLREEFGFDGTPIEVSVRVRERRSGLTPYGRSLRCLGCDAGHRDVAQFGSALDWGSRGRGSNLAVPTASSQVRGLLDVQPLQ